MQDRITPKDKLVADIVSKFDDGLRELFEERAGIMEFDGQLDRAHAECLALIDVMRRHPEAPTKAESGTSKELPSYKK